MPERSPEIEQVLRERVDALARSDVGEIGRRTSRDACALLIGSDASEWAEGYDEIMRGFSDSTPDGDGATTVCLVDVKAFREGSVGWAASRGYFELERKRVPVRSTAVFHQEDGEWKAVQVHVSIGVPNERLMDAIFQSEG